MKRSFVSLLGILAVLIAGIFGVTKTYGFAPVVSQPYYQSPSSTLYSVNITPQINNTGSVGDPTHYWNAGYFTNLYGGGGGSSTTTSSTNAFFINTTTTNLAVTNAEAIGTYVGDSSEAGFVPQFLISTSSTAGMMGPIPEAIFNQNNPASAAVIELMTQGSGGVAVFGATGPNVSGIPTSTVIIGNEQSSGNGIAFLPAGGSITTNISPAGNLSTSGSVTGAGLTSSISGSFSAPSIGWTDGAGFYHGSGIVNVTSGGGTDMAFTSTQNTTYNTIAPYNNGFLDLGASGNQFRNIWASGTTTLATSTIASLNSSNATLTGGTINNVVIGGTTAVNATFATTTINNALIVPLGSAGAPSILSTSANSGMYFSSSGNAINMDISGGNIFQVNSSGLQMQNSKNILTTNNTGSVGTLTAAFNGVFTYGLNASGTVTMVGLGAPGSPGDNVLCWNTSSGVVSQQATNCTVSSERFKDHIQSLSPTQLLDEVRRLRAVQFDYIPSYGGQHSEGFIAEEVAQIDPYMVVWIATTSTADIAHVTAKYPSVVLQKDGQTFIPQTVAYDHISVLLTGALQAEDARVTDQQTQITTLQGEFKSLDTRESLLEKAVKWLESLFKK